jgi:hypothetical protein
MSYEEEKDEINYRLKKISDIIAEITARTEDILSKIKPVTDPKINCMDTINPDSLEVKTECVHHLETCPRCGQLLRK